MLAAFFSLPKALFRLIIFDSHQDWAYSAREKIIGRVVSKLGKFPKIGPRVVVYGQKIEIGDNFSSYWDCRIVSEKSLVIIGNNVVFSHHVDVSSGPGGYIKIGDNCLIAQFCVFRNCSHTFSDPTVLIKDQGHTQGNIEIGDDCHLASSVIILPNTKLGKGCVVGSGSVVSGTFPDYSIIAGHPARIVNKRG